jgi:membrane protein required for beta-lactamase induction
MHSANDLEAEEGDWEEESEEVKRLYGYLILNHFRKFLRDLFLTITCKIEPNIDYKINYTV